MKRSEMVSIIQNYLKVYGIHYGACDEVLTLIEKAGMQPPLRWRHPKDSDWESTRFKPVPFESSSWKPEEMDEATAKNYHDKYGYPDDEKE